MSLHADIEDVAGLRIVRISGELDSFTSALLRETLRRELANCPEVLPVDLSGLEFLGVAGVEVLLGMRQNAERVGTALVLTGAMKPAVVRLLRLVGWWLTAGGVHTRCTTAPGRLIRGRPPPSSGVSAR